MCSSCLTILGKIFKTDVKLGLLTEIREEGTLGSGDREVILKGTVSPRENF